MVHISFARGEWDTTYVRNPEGKVTGLVHQFDNNIVLKTDLQERTVSRYHGDVLVQESSLNPDLDSYIQLLQNTAGESEQAKIMLL